MYNKLVELLNNSYSPYSEFRVSAIIEMKDGSIVGGVNVENASYGASICAERSALVSAVSRGYKKDDFKAIHILTNNDKVTYPCFICRQVLIEFFSLDSKVFLYGRSGEVKEEIIGLICPNAFTKDDLNI